MVGFNANVTDDEIVSVDIVSWYDGETQNKGGFGLLINGQTTYTGSLKSLVAL